METPDGIKRQIRVTIFNQSYTLSSSGDPSDTEELAREIDELMSAIARRGGNLDSTRTAVLACLHLADQLRETERELGALKSSIGTKARRFNEMLDSLFPPETSD